MKLIALALALIATGVMADPLDVTIVGKDGKSTVHFAHSKHPLAKGPEATIQGTLRVLHSDDFTGTSGSNYDYTVEDNKGQQTLLNVELLPADKVKANSGVKVKGKRNQSTQEVDPSTITITSEPQALATPTINKTLAYNVTLGTTPSGQTAASLRSLMDTTNSYFQEVSYGTQALQTDITPPLSIAETSACNYTNVQTQADAAATAAGFTPANYRFHVYFVPKNCSWAGLSYVGYGYSWIGVAAPYVTSHEMGHAFGLLHSGNLNCSGGINGSCSVAEYGNLSSMGNTGRTWHYGAIEKSKLGWINASQVTARTVGQGLGTYNLDPLELASGKTYAVKIPTSISARTYWVEYRQPVGIDQGLTESACIWLSSPFERSAGNDDEQFVQCLTPGSTYTDQVAALTINVGSAPPPPPPPAGAIWVDDAIPSGANPASDGGDNWQWVTTANGAPPKCGSFVQQSSISAGEHQHYFQGSPPLVLPAGKTLYAWVYLDPANPPKEAMLQWNDGSWEHRAYWGQNLITWGSDGTPSRLNMGALPALGQWVQLTVPALQVGIDAHTINGMAFTLYDGRAWWDCGGYQ